MRPIVYVCCDLDYLCVALYFYVSWVDDDHRDVLSAKKLVTDSDDSVQDVPIGSTQQPESHFNAPKFLWGWQSPPD